METDKLFLLSLEEVNEYLPTEKSRMCNYNGEYVWWWLRTPGSFANIATYVYNNGCINYLGSSVILHSIAVRPALHLNLAYLNTLEHTRDGRVYFAGREWLVLDEETGLLLSKKAICLHHFDDNSNKYEQSEIRAYLNEKMYNDLFTTEERKIIVDTVIDGETSSPADVSSQS